MNYAVSRRTVAGRHLAVVRDRRSWSQLGAQLLSLLDRVYVVVRAGQIIQTGHNVFVYREPTSDGVTVEIGVEVAAPFEEVDGVRCAMTPAGEVVSTVHMGDYARLGAAYDALVAWCDEHQVTRAGVWWEVYGDWHEDPSMVQTEVFHLLRTHGS
jgi:effector-binding domain-containing protein